MEKIVKILAIKYNLPEKDIEQIINSLFDFIRKTISNSNIENMDYEEIIKSKVNFIFPSFGTLHINKKKLLRIKENLKMKK